MTMKLIGAGLRPRHVGPQWRRAYDGESPWEEIWGDAPLDGRLALGLPLARADRRLPGREGAAGVRDHEPLCEFLEVDVPAKAPQPA